MSYPQLQLAMSACNATAAQTWHLSLTLESSSPLSEVFFELEAALEDSTMVLGEDASGTACCGQYKYYAFPGVDERVAPLVDFNLTSGNIKVPHGCIEDGGGGGGSGGSTDGGDEGGNEARAWRCAPELKVVAPLPQALYWKYNSCPIEEQDATFGSGSSGLSDCRGWCVLQWYRRYSPNLGQVRAIAHPIAAAPTSHPSPTSISSLPLGRSRIMHGVPSFNF